MGIRFGVVFATLGFVFALLFPSVARAQDAERCFPKCRSGFVCSAEAKCVSECNPPCASGEACRAGQCAIDRTSHASTSGESGEPDAPVSSEPKKIEMVWAGGAGVHVSKTSAPVLLTSFSVAFGGRHAFLAGLQGGVAFFDSFIGTNTIGELGLNLGYRGIFTRGEVGVGLMVVAQPQVWFAGDALLGLGGAVGGVLTYKRLVVEVPISVSRVAVFKNHLQTSKKAVVVTPAILVGVSF
jgi:hypothetical protein